MFAGDEKQHTQAASGEILTGYEVFTVRKT